MATKKKNLKSSTTPAFAYDSTEGRTYVWKAESFSSVTTILKALPHPALEAWKLRQIVKAAIEFKDELPAMEDELIEAKLSASMFGTRDTAGNVGSSVHSYLEHITKGTTVGPPSEAASGYVHQFRRFLDDFNPTFLEAETTVYSRTYGYAGTMDAMVEIDGIRYILDYKTGKSIYPEVALQLAAYSHADFIGRKDGQTEDEIPTVKRGLVLHIRPDKYVLRYARVGNDTFETFLSVLDLHRWDAEQYSVLGAELFPR